MTGGNIDFAKELFAEPAGSFAVGLEDITMKAVIGIDNEGHYRSAINLLARLRFDRPRAELVHVEEPTYLFGTSSYPAAVPFNVAAAESASEITEELLASARDECCDMGIFAVSTSESGNPIHVLLRIADEQHADVIVVGSTQKTKYGSFFLGGVGRGLAIGSRRSVLIAKGRVAETGKLRAVFAIDYSEYSEECMRMLARMHPAGFERLVLVTAVDSLGNLPRGTDAANHARKHIQERANSAIQHLKEFGITAEYRIVEGSVGDVIDASMIDIHADLLIMGAHGHGFVDRLILGSASLQEVVGSPHSVLLLRQ